MKKSVETDNITFTGIYERAEPMVRYYPDGSGYPGCPAEFEIIDIEGDIVDFLVNIVEPIISRYNERVKEGTPAELNIWEELSNLCLEKIGEEEE